MLLRPMKLGHESGLELRWLERPPDKREVGSSTLPRPMTSRESWRPMRLRVGTSGYNFPEWKGTFYPARIKPAEMLPYYAERLSAVEVNYTFYRMPNARTVAGWMQAVPEGFTFVLKAPQRITHIARLRDVEDPLRYFTETIRPLGVRLGPILFQLPPNFKQDLARLKNLLTLFPADLRCAWEFRHPSWFADDTYEALRTANAALCVADSEEGNTALESTADFGYFRLRNEGYGKEDLERWAERVRELGRMCQGALVFFQHAEAGRGGGRGSMREHAFFFTKPEEAGAGPKLAQAFAALFRSCRTLPAPRPLL